MNGQEVAPGYVDFGSPNGEITNSMQWLASPVPAGTYIIKIQLMTGGGQAMFLYSRTLSVLRSVV